MQTPTIVKQTRDYMIVKIPLPRHTAAAPQPFHPTMLAQKANGKLTLAEKRLWKIIQDGEREYREGKTIRARSIDEALKTHARKKN